MEFKVRIEPRGNSGDWAYLHIDTAKIYMHKERAVELKKRIEAHDKLVSAVVSAHGEALMMARDLRDPFRSLLDRLINEQLKPALKAAGLLHC